MVSIIVPIYNLGNLLDSCVESIFNQTYTNLEILLVDDGSTDDSPQKCDAYAQGDSRVKALHKPNGGLSDARNYGLAHATGDYVLYLDGDDWMDANAVAKLREAAGKYRADIVQSNYYYAYNDYLLLRKETEPVMEFTKESALKELLSDGMIKNFAWGSLLKRDLAVKVSFVKGKYFEDSYWKYKIIALSQKYVYLSTPLFYYRQRSGSISAEFSLKNMDLLLGNEQRLDFIKEKYPSLFYLALRQQWLTAFQFMKLSEKSTNEVKAGYLIYFTNFQNQYRSYLDKAVKGDSYIKILYLIHNQYPVVYPMFMFGNRVLNRFKSSNYKRIKL